MPRQQGSRTGDSHSCDDFYPDDGESVPENQRLLTQTPHSAMSSPSNAPTSPRTPEDGDPDRSSLAFTPNPDLESTADLRQFQQNNLQMDSPSGIPSPRFGIRSGRPSRGRFATTQSESDPRSADPSITPQIRRSRPGPPPLSPPPSYGGRGHETAQQLQTVSDYPTQQSGPGRSLLPSPSITERVTDRTFLATSRSGVRSRGGSGPPPSQPAPPPPP